MPKEQSKRVTRRYKHHPLENFVNMDEVPITMHPSPLPSIKYEHKYERKEASRMELKLSNFLYDFNSPCNGQARSRLPVGECEEQTFEMYMCRTMEPHMYTRVEQYSPWVNRTGDTEITRHIIYEFQYPNFPSFGDGEWAKNYTTVNQKSVGDSLRKRFNVDIPEDFDTIAYRCIASKLVISYDTRLELYYAHLNHWVQAKDGKVWIESF